MLPRWNPPFRTAPTCFMVNLPVSCRCCVLVTGAASDMPMRLRTATVTPADLPLAMVFRPLATEAFQPAVLAAASAPSHSGFEVRFDSCPSTKSADVSLRNSSVLLHPSGLVESTVQLPSCCCRFEPMDTPSDVGHSTSCESAAISSARSRALRWYPRDFVRGSAGAT